MGAGFTSAPFFNFFLKIVKKEFTFPQTCAIITRRKNAISTRGTAG